MKTLLGLLLGSLFALSAVAGTPVTVYGPTYGTAATVSPLGELRVENPASQIFLDTFDTGTLDTVNRWTATNGGTGVLPSNAVGQTVLNGGTTANSFSKLSSQPSFAPVEPGYLLFNSRVNFPFPAPTTAVVDLGLGTSSATPTVAAPVIQCVCFEMTTAGKLQAVVYQTGTRVLIADLNGLGYQPVDSAAHKYFIYFRGDIAYWALDDKDNVVANYQTGASGPDINTLPLLFQVVSNGTPAVSLQVNAATLGDTAHTVGGASDGTFRWRAQTVGPKGDAVSSLYDGLRATYSASTVAAAGVVGDTIVLTGSATKTIRILRVDVSGTATAATDVDLQVFKRTTADTGGTTGTAPTIVKHDTNDPAATATIALYTAAPTAGTGAAVRAGKLLTSTATTQAPPQAWDFGTRPSHGIVLRGTAEQGAINLSAAPAGGSFDIDVEWTEE